RTRATESFERKNFPVRRFLGRSLARRDDGDRAMLDAERQDALVSGLAGQNGQHSAGEGHRRAGRRGELEIQYHHAKHSRFGVKPDSPARSRSRTDREPRTAFRNGSAVAVRAFFSGWPGVSSLSPTLSRTF